MVHNDVVFGEKHLCCFAADLAIHSQKLPLGLWEVIESDIAQAAIMMWAWAEVDPSSRGYAEHVDGVAELSWQVEETKVVIC